MNVLAMSQLKADKAFSNYITWGSIGYPEGYVDLAADPGLFQTSRQKAGKRLRQGASKHDHSHVCLLQEWHVNVPLSAGSHKTTEPHSVQEPSDSVKSSF